MIIISLQLSASIGLSATSAICIHSLWNSSQALATSSVIVQIFTQVVVVLSISLRLLIVALVSILVLVLWVLTEWSSLTHSS